MENHKILKNLIFLLLLTIPNICFANSNYLIEKSNNDEFFLINGEKYRAKTYCFGMQEGDRVVFVQGSAYGACSSAELLNLSSNKICKVWCE